MVETGTEVERDYGSMGTGSWRKQTVGMCCELSIFGRSIVSRLQVARTVLLPVAKARADFRPTHLDLVLYRVVWQIGAHRFRRFLKFLPLQKVE